MSSLNLNENEFAYPIEVILQEGGKLDCYGVTHIFAHGDEFGAMLFAQIIPVTREFVQKYAPDRCFYFGVRRGPFDEHPDPARGIERKKGESAITLYVKKLQEECGFSLDDHPALKAITMFLSEKDRKANADPMDITRLIKKLSRYYKLHPDFSSLNMPDIAYKICDWVMFWLWIKSSEDPDHFKTKLSCFQLDYLKAAALRNHPEMTDVIEEKYQEGMAAHRFSKELFQRAGTEFQKLERVSVTFEGKDFYAGNLKSDNPECGNYSRSRNAKETGRYVDMLLQENSKGNICIFFNNTALLSAVPKIASVLRKAILGAKGLPLPEERLLYAEGAIEGAEELYFFVGEDGMSILNGSETHPNVPPFPQEVRGRKAFEIVLSAITP